MCLLTCLLMCLLTCLLTCLFDVPVKVPVKCLLVPCGVPVKCLLNPCGVPVSWCGVPVKVPVSFCLYMHIESMCLLMRGGVPTSALTLGNVLNLLKKSPTGTSNRCACCCFLYQQAHRIDVPVDVPACLLRVPA